MLNLRNKSACEVVEKLKSVFATFGIPDMLCADNVPFGSSVIKDFAREWGFDVATRSPNFPQSNGLAEKAVGIAKNLLKKSLCEGSDLQYGLLQYRSTPLKYLGYSPAQLLCGRRYKTKVPISKELLEPVLCKNVIDKLKARQDVNHSYYNRCAKDLKPLKVNDNVTVYNPVKKIWQPGKIIGMSRFPRSYHVVDAEGNSVRRNRFDLRPSLNAPELNSDILSDVTDVPVQPGPRPLICEREAATTDDAYDSVDLEQPATVEDALGTLGDDAQFTRSGRQVKPINRLDL